MGISAKKREEVVFQAVQSCQLWASYYKKWNSHLLKQRFHLTNSTFSLYGWWKGSFMLLTDAVYLFSACVSPFLKGGCLWSSGWTRVMNLQRDKVEEKDSCFSLSSCDQNTRSRSWPAGTWNLLWRRESGMKRKMTLLKAARSAFAAE